MVMASALTTTVGELSDSALTMSGTGASGTDSNNSKSKNAGTTNMAASTLEPSESAKQAVVVSLR
jgi:hypothetical protein